MSEKDTQTAPCHDCSCSRRKFLTDVTTGVGVVGAAAMAYPFVKSMSPAANVKAMSTTEVDLSAIAEGETKTVMWRGRPVFVRHRTPAEIEHVRAENTSTQLLDPQNDEDRVQKEQWLVVMGVCTHLGCVPLNGGNFGGWLCPCHGSQFDASGRLRRGPAAANLEIPPYSFVNDSTIKIG